MRGGKRFGDVVIGTQFQAGNDIRFLSLGGEHDNRRIRGSRVLFEPSGHLQAIDARQHQVEDDKVHRVGFRRFQGGFARFRTDHRISFADQVVADQFEDILFVIHHQDFLFTHFFNYWFMVSGFMKG